MFLPKEPSLKYDCFYYTNNKDILELIKDSVWIGVYDDVPVTENLVESQYSSKEVRVKPSEYKELLPYDYTCYLDSKLQDINELFIEDLIAKYFIEQNYVMLLRQHWYHHGSGGGNVWEEAFESMFQSRYRAQMGIVNSYIRNQISKGFSPITEKHYATGLIIKNMKHERARELETVWWDHIKECGTQCQISFFFVKQLFDGLIHPFSENPFLSDFKPEATLHYVEDLVDIKTP